MRKGSRNLTPLRFLGADLCREGAEDKFVELLQCWKSGRSSSPGRVAVPGKASAAGKEPLFLFAYAQDVEDERDGLGVLYIVVTGPAGAALGWRPCS